MKKSFIITVMALIILVACKKNTGSNTGGNPGGGNPGGAGPVITSTSPDYVFWGEPLTIIGTGFSTTKDNNHVWIDSDNSCSTSRLDSTDWKKAEVLSATATKLVIKAPTRMVDSLLCGPERGTVHVTVNGKTAISPGGKFI